MNANEAVNQLVELLDTKNAEQIAEIEIILTRIGLTKLSAYAAEAGVINAGGDYIDELTKAIEKTVNWKI